MTQSTNDDEEKTQNSASGTRNKSIQEVGKLDVYIRNIKENITYFIGLGGTLLVLLVFHYSVFRIRELEYYHVNENLLNESELVSGLRIGTESIFITLSFFILLSILAYIPIKKLFKRNVETISEKASDYTVIYAIALIFICGLIILIIHIRFHYEGFLRIPDSVQSFVFLAFVLIIYTFAFLFSFFKTTQTENGESKIEVPVLGHGIFLVLIFLLVFLPFIVFNYTGINKDRALVTEDAQYMLVEARNDKLLLRKIENVKVKKETDEFNEELESCIKNIGKSTDKINKCSKKIDKYKKTKVYKLTDEYTIKDFSKQTLVEVGLDKNTDTELTKTIQFDKIKKENKQK